MRRFSFADWVFSTFGRQQRRRFHAIALCLPCALSMALPSLHAQPAVAGAPTIVLAGLAGPSYVSTFYTGFWSDVIIADAGCTIAPTTVGEDCNIWMATPAASGRTYTQSLIVPDAPGIRGLMVDSSLDVYYMVPYVLYEETPEGPQQGPPWSQGDVSCPSLVSPTGLFLGPPLGFYVADSSTKSIYSLGLPPNCASASVLISGIASLGPIAVDSKGNIYMASGGTVFKETLSGTTYTQSLVNSGYSSVKGIAVDSSLNVYISDEGGNVYEDSPCPGNYSQVVVFTPPSAPGGIALDFANNIYVTEPKGGRVWEVPSRTGSAGTPAPPTCVAGTVGSASQAKQTPPPAKQPQPPAIQPQH
jgi:hypothetical protein